MTSVWGRPQTKEQLRNLKRCFFSLVDLAEEFHPCPSMSGKISLIDPVHLGGDFRGMPTRYAIL
jgi:hypothetical protein